jgi:hypothetical protein
MQIAMQQNLSAKNELKMTFNIRQIQVLGFTINNSPQHQSLKHDHNYTFEINVGTLIDPENKFIGINFKTNVFTSSTKDDSVCELSILASYHIINFDEVVHKDEKEFTIPDRAMQHLIAVTLSTARGILFEKVQGTFLSNLVLPIIDVTKLNKNQAPEL